MIPSPLKSPIAMPATSPAVKDSGAEGAVSIAEQDGEAAAGSVGAAERDVGIAITVEVGEQDLMATPRGQPG